MTACLHRTLAGRRACQAGLSLIVTLIMLVVITLLGLAAVSGTVMQEQIVGNTRDANLAFQAAEAGLRDAENDVATNITAETGFTSACSQGLCTPPSTWPSRSSTPLWQLLDWGNPTLTRNYGDYTGAAALSPDLAAPPRYVIERLSAQQAGVGDSVGLGIGPNVDAGTYYRITVYATGGRADTHIVMQSIYLKH